MRIPRLGNLKGRIIGLAKVIVGFIGYRWLNEDMLPGEDKKTHRIIAYVALASFGVYVPLAKAAMSWFEAGREEV